MLDIVYPSRWM